ncbi:unnamed protein product [Prorocentrum cordatum]|uniref:Uncharacterized protein n=1 Tax=Prorocentrum cordatum TaxID=2364126 RepID=A0ABN9VMI0_9DINO|nr:unnamed protein product [Polarella glacialis]
MAFCGADITAMLATAPNGSFNGAGAVQIREWVDFVLSVDPNPSSKHDLFYYVAVSRLLAEAVGSISPSDFEDPHMRDMIKGSMAINDVPYASEPDEKWKTWKVVPAQIAFALRVQAKCAQAALPAPTATFQPATESMTGMAEAVKQFAELQSQALQKGKPKGLSFKLQDRLVETGMQDFARGTLPSEEVLAKFEASGKIARDKGRHWVGSAEGEDLREHHRPQWSRTPVVDAIIGGGSYEDRVKQSAAVKRSGAWVGKIDYISFATFMGHLNERGFKLILTKACKMSDFFAYSNNIIRIAEDLGGVRTEFQYDVLQRKAMAQALERDEKDLTLFFTEIDRSILKGASASPRPPGLAERRRVRTKDFRASSGGKGAKNDKGGDDRRPRSPERRPKGSTSKGHPRSRSPRATAHGSSWEKRWWK